MQLPASNKSHDEHGGWRGEKKKGRIVVWMTCQCSCMHDHFSSDESAEDYEQVMKMNRHVAHDMLVHYAVSIHLHRCIMCVEHRQH